MKYQGDSRKMDPNFSPSESVMPHYGVPMTRENFLVFGGFEGEPDTEQESEIPLRFRLCERCWVYPCQCTIPGVAEVCECDPCSARRNAREMTW